MKFSRIVAHLGAAALLAFGAAAVAQDYPSRPIKLIVPYPPGGGIDPSARVVAESMSKQLNVSIVIDNMGGASGRIGTTYASRAKPDGYTLLFASGAPNAILPAAYGTQLGYDGAKNFMPIGLVTHLNYALVATSALPVKSLAELLAYAKAHPKGISYASSGLLSGPHLAGELLTRGAGIDAVHAPYQGTGPAMTAVMGGVVSIMFETENNVVAKASSGKYHVLAVTGKQPSAFPDVPNLGKLYPGHDVSQWYGLMAIAGTPPEIVNRLADALNKALRSDEIKKHFAAMGLKPVVDSTPESFNAYIASEIDRWKVQFRPGGIAVPAM